VSPSLVSDRPARGTARPTLLGAVLLPLGVAALLAGALAVSFAVGYGMSNVIPTISRGTLPMYLFGSGGYATSLGAAGAVPASRSGGRRERPDAACSCFAGGTNLCHSRRRSTGGVRLSALAAEPLPKRRTLPPESLTSTPRTLLPNLQPRSLQKARYNA
jgi:hypothetical protein